MSKQVRARAIRRGARFAMERHMRKQEAKRLELPPGPRRPRAWPWVALCLAVWVAVWLTFFHASSAHGAELEQMPAPTGEDIATGGALVFGYVVVALTFYVAITLAAHFLTRALRAWRRKDRL
jgi:hypothetical protein